MRACWAQRLGNCSDKITGEHIVTAGLFLTDMVTVQGLSWCLDQPKTIGLPNLTRNILCGNHNSSLSAVDEAAIEAFDVFRECMRLQNVRAAMRERAWNVTTFAVDGAQLERWFLKTLINVASGGPHPIGPKSQAVGEPSTDLVEVAFGLLRFQPAAGLYFSGEVGENIMSEERITIIPFFDFDNKYVAGGTFYFRGCRFMLYLGEEGMPGKVNFLHKDGRLDQHSPPLYHIHKLNFNVGKSQRYLSHVAEFEWRADHP